MHISLPEGYTVASASTPLLAPGARAYDIAKRVGLDRPLRIALWVYEPPPPGSARSALENAVIEEDASVFSYTASASSTPLVSTIVAGRRGWQRKFSSCLIHQMLQVVYIELRGGEIVRIAIYGQPNEVSAGVQSATFEAIKESITFDVPS